MVEFLLKVGARARATNNLGKTAAKMAAFVGKQDLVALFVFMCCFCSFVLFWFVVKGKWNS